MLWISNLAPLYAALGKMTENSEDSSDDVNKLGLGITLQ